MEYQKSSGGSALNHKNLVNRNSVKLFCLGLLFSSPSFAANAEKNSEVNNEAVEAMPSNLFSKTEYDAAFKSIWKSPSAKKIKRSIASQDGMSEAQANSMMSDSFKALKKRIIELKTTKQLQALLEELDAQLVKDSIKDADTKFFASQFVLIRPWRALTWKMIPVVEDTRMSHSGMLTALRNLSSRWHTMFPDSQWTVGFNYVTEPFDGSDKQFKGESDLYEHVRTNIYTSLRTAYMRVKAVKFKNSIWDNQLLYGRIDTFKDDHFRFKKLTEADHQIVLGQMAAGMAQIKQFAAYNTHGLLQVSENVGKVFGMDGFAYSDTEGVTDERLTEQVQKARRKHPRLLTIKTSDKDGIDGAKLMNQSYELWNTSYRHMLLAWNEVKAGSAETERLINPLVFQGHEESIDAGLANVGAMLEGSRPVVSKATGETVLVDMKKFYSNPPADLFALLPYKFEEQKNRCPSNANTTTRGLRGSSCGSLPQVRNYDWGSATHWHAAAHKTYLPELASDTDLAQKRKIAVEASSSWFATIPLALF